MNTMRALRCGLAPLLAISAGCGITDASGPDTLDGTVVNVFTDAPLDGVFLTLIERGELVAPDRTIASATTAADGSFSISYAAGDVRCPGLVLRVERRGYDPVGEAAAWWIEGSVEVGRCGDRSLRVSLAPRPEHIVLSPREITVRAGERARFGVAVRYVDGTLLSGGRRIGDVTYGLASLRPDPTWESLEECGIAAHHDGREGVYDAPASPPPASCGAGAGAVRVWAYAADDRWDVTSDSLLVRVLPR